MKSLGYDPLHHRYCRLCKDHIRITGGGYITSITTPPMVADMSAYSTREWMSKGTCLGCRLVVANYNGDRLGIASVEYYSVFPWARVIMNKRWTEMNGYASAITGEENI